MEFARARTGEAVAAVVERAVARLDPAAGERARFVPPDTHGRIRDASWARPGTADVVAIASALPGNGVRAGELLVDRGTAGRPELLAALETIGVAASLAVERIRLDAELARHARDQFNALIEHTADVILIVDDDNRIRYASPSARVLLGTSALRGTALLDLVDPAERRSAEYLLRHVRTAGVDPHAVARADWTLRTADERTPRVEVSCRDLRAENSVRGVVVTLRDVSAQRSLEHELTRQLYRDPLTELPNRLLFDERVSEALAAAADVTGVLLINLDNFRVINEGLGRETGDAVMRAVAARLLDTAGGDRVTARLAGDEFAVLVANATVQAIDELAARLVQAMAAPILDAEDALSCTCSIGVATTAEASTQQELMRHADLALDAAKAAGGARWRRYEPAMTGAVMYRLEMRSALAQALREGALLLEYQPIVALDTGHTAGLEALVRWRHPTRGLLTPGEFIDIAEESGLITPMGEWVLSTAIRSASRWPRPAHHDPPYVSVNVSAQQFRAGGFVDMACRLLTEAGLPPARLVLEITESLLLRDDERVWEDLERLRRSGIGVAIDDFGTGYSALSYLRQVPLDIVKLDRIFISTMAQSTRQRELVRGIVGLTRALDLTVVAEGIETEQQHAICTAAGCTHGQGYLYAPPMPEPEVAAWLADAPHGLGTRPRPLNRPA